MNPNQTPTNPVKSPYTKTRYTQEQIEELRKCVSDPVHFIETYMRVRHPVKGNIPFELYDYQKDIVKIYHEHRNAILLTGRQMGKSIDQNTYVNKNGSSVRIRSLLKLNFRQKLVGWLEAMATNLARRIV